MRIYKELEALGFFDWYCRQYGGLNFTEYRDVYDQLPLDNLIRTELNACVFKFFREQYELYHSIQKSYETKKFFFNIKRDGIVVTGTPAEGISESYDKAELNCIKEFLQYIKSNNLKQKVSYES